MNAIEMEPGNLYRVTFHQQSGNGRWYRREMTAVYLGFNQQNKEWQFSLRPLLGTTSLSKRYHPIERIELIEKGVSRKYPHGVRDQALAKLIKPSVSLGPVEKKYRDKNESIEDLSLTRLDKVLLAAREASVTRWPYTGTNDNIRLIEAEYKRRGELLPEDRDA